MTMDELFDISFYDNMYLLFAMAFFLVEGANLLVPSAVNANFKRILSRFTSFFKGFIGAGGWNGSGFFKLESFGGQFNDGLDRTVQPAFPAG